MLGLWILCVCLARLPPILTVLVGEASQDVKIYTSLARGEEALRCLSWAAFSTACHLVVKSEKQKMLTSLAIGIGLSQGLSICILSLPESTKQIFRAISWAFSLLPIINCVDLVFEMIQDGAQWWLDPRVLGAASGVLWYLLGVGFMVTAIPERFFDTWFTGRALAHLFATLGQASFLLYLHVAATQGLSSATSGASLLSLGASHDVL